MYGRTSHNLVLRLTIDYEDLLFWEVWFVAKKERVRRLSVEK